MTTWARRSGVSASWRCNRSLTEGSAGHEFYGVLSEQVVSRYAVDMGDHRVQIDVWSRLRFLPIFTKDPISALANTDTGLKHEGTRVAGSSQGDAWGCPKTTPWNLAAHHGAGQGDHGAAVSLLALSADAGDSWVPHGAESPAPGGERPSSCLGVSTARFYWPSGVAVDNAGSVYVANTDNHASRRVTPDGVVTTLAGGARQSGRADGLVRKPPALEQERRFAKHHRGVGISGTCLGSQRGGMISTILCEHS